MYQPMLYLHWKQIRFGLIPFMLAAFALPLLSIQGLGVPPGADAAAMAPYVAMQAAQMWLPFFPMLAAGIGFALALSAWTWDHQLRHVYALSLPVSRREYAMLKMGAGAVLALLPAGAFWVGAQLASASITLPEGLQAYPHALAIRFFASILVAYAVVFSMAAGTVKTTVWILTAIVGFLLVGVPVSELLGTYIPSFQGTNLFEVVVLALMRAPGPLQVFFGSWMLIDV